MRHTLSSNNRALARALELKKAELTTAVSLITNLRTENHSLKAEVNRLQSCNGMGSESWEQEVNLRVQVSVFALTVLFHNVQLKILHYVTVNIRM